MTFSKPFFYPAYLAPFVRLSPRRGALVANVVILALASLLAARTLRRWVGPWSALWIALFVFGSAAFVYAYWAHADLFLMALTAISLSLAFSDPEGTPTRISLAKWLLAGVLLAAVAFSRPFYLPLLIPAAFCAPRPRRPRLAAYCAGILLLVVASLAVHQSLGDSWTSYDGQRAGFYGGTGFPDVDFPRAEWTDFIFRWGDRAWSPAAVELERTVSLRIWLWNSFYFGFGQHVGVLVYFLPLVLGLISGPKDHPRWALAAAIVAAIAGAFFLRPFNFFGGGASIANRYFLPIYPAFWLLPGGPLRWRWLAGVAVASALFVWPLWAEPGGYVVRPDGTYRFVSPVADALLPNETTQSHIKPSGQKDLRQDGIWVRLLGPEVRSQDGEHLTLARQTRGSMLLGRLEALEEIDLVVRQSLKVSVETNAEIINRQRAGDAQVFRLRLGARRAFHPMWWIRQDINLYRLDLEFDSASEFPVPFALERAVD